MESSYSYSVLAARSKFTENIATAAEATQCINPFIRALVAVGMWPLPEKTFYILAVLAKEKSVSSPVVYASFLTCFLKFLSC